MSRRELAWEMALIGLACFLAYAPALSLPLIEDDYSNLGMAQLKGSPAGVAAIFHDPIFRVRATSCWLMYGVWKGFGLWAPAYHVASLLLHFANCLLVYGVLRLCGLDEIGGRKRLPHGTSFWAALFFAVQEGHQEAIMWFSACNELVLFLFGAGSLACWLMALREDAPKAQRVGWEIASVAAFGLALVSKESAVIWLPLFLVAAAGSADWRRSARRLAPHVALALAAVTSVWMTRAYSFRFSDGSFSLAAPFWITWPRGMARLLWVWGWIALAGIAWRRESDLWKPAGAALAWMGMALVPYSFLTYSTQIPSRQTYVASAGLAVMFGLAMARLAREPGTVRKLAVAAAVAMLVSNVGYLWTKKRAQFLERAEPTEQLIRLARQTPGPIWMECFPRNRYVAEEAVRVAAGRSPEILVWSQAEAAARKATATFCSQEP